LLDAATAARGKTSDPYRKPARFRPATGIDLTQEFAGRRSLKAHIVWEGEPTNPDEEGVYQCGECIANARKEGDTMVVIMCSYEGCKNPAWRIQKPGESWVCESHYTGSEQDALGAPNGSSAMKTLNPHGIDRALRRARY
jgi:hypothetical protein